MAEAELKVYKVWDVPTRWFHWINAAAVLGLMIFGFLLSYRKVFDIHGPEAKYALITAHTLIGYVFGLNLLWRLIWGFVGNRYARWPSLLPNRQSLKAVGFELRALSRRQPLAYVGHSPLGRISMTLMFMVMILLALTGFIRAGTDLYYPPLGGAIAAYVAKPGVAPSDLKPGDKSLVHQARYDEVKRLKGPIGRVHYYAAYALLALVLLHIAGVVTTEIRQGGGIVSAMFSGQKILTAEPVDDHGL